MLDHPPNQSADTTPTEAFIDFGFENVPRDEKVERVRAVFDSVADSYDVMNDVMSLGVHRLWKDALMDWMAPRPSQHLVDLAGGTGDISKRFLSRGGGSAEVVDINTEMMAAGQKRRDLAVFGDRLTWREGNAEKLPLEDACCDRVTIAFGLRNVTDRQAALSEAHRILKPGGRFCCLEFSSVNNPVLRGIYDRWSFDLLPIFGQLIAKDRASYEYLVESIRRFPPQHELADMFAEAGFAQVRIRNLSGGIAAIHSGWKLD